MAKLTKSQVKQLRIQMKSMVLMSGYKILEAERAEIVRLLTKLIRSETTSD